MKENLVFYETISRLRLFEGSLHSRSRLTATPRLFIKLVLKKDRMVVIIKCHSISSHVVYIAHSCIRGYEKSLASYDTNTADYPGELYMQGIIITRLLLTLQNS